MLKAMSVQSAQVLWYSHRLIWPSSAVFLAAPLNIPVPGLFPVVRQSPLQRRLLQRVPSLKTAGGEPHPPAVIM